MHNCVVFQDQTENYTVEADIIGIIEVIVLYFMSLQYVILYGRTSSHKIL